MRGLRKRRTLPLRAVLTSIVLSLVATPSPAQSVSEPLVFRAVRQGNIPLLRSLVRRGAAVDLVTADGTTPLIEAARHANADAVALLLDAGADPRIANDRGVTALLSGAHDTDKVRQLLDAGADVNARSALGTTPLMVAAAAPAGSESAEMLLAAGGDYMARNANGRSVLRHAVGAGNLATVAALLAKADAAGERAEMLRQAGPVVAIAAGQGFQDVVQCLVDNGAEVNRSTGSRGTALNSALLAGDTEIALMLIEHGSELTAKIRPGDVPTVVLAAYNERETRAVLTALKERGADLKADTAKHETSLTWARLRGHEGLTKWLANEGVAEGETPSKPEIPQRTVNLHAGNRLDLLTRSIQKSVDLLQLSSDTFLDERRNCVSCHHQNLPGVAIAWAGERGFAVSKQTVDRMIQRQVKSWTPRIQRSYQLDSPYPVPPRFLGYGMWSFAELGHRPDALTRAVSWYLAATQQPDGRWVPGMLRPPLGGDEILATMLAMRALQLYPLPGDGEQLAAIVDRARNWLQHAEPKTHQQRVYRLLGLAWSGLSAEELQDQSEPLLAMQRSDGGWAQLPGLESDAWATGQTLVALFEAGALSAESPEYRRGLEFLLRTQFDDGSWFVQARTWPFQAHFESKFPHGRDQWISAPATAWAVMALTRAVRPNEAARVREVTAKNKETAAQGAVAEASDADTKAAEVKTLAPAAKQTIDFRRDIQPLFARSCNGCHGGKEPASNFALNGRDALLRGGDSEVPAILPGDSKQSPLVRFAAGLVPDLPMPPKDALKKYPPLSAAEIGLLRAWIDQGAAWPN